jgi:hypothetical protein
MEGTHHMTSPRARAGVLLAAFALVGGTGCITASVVSTMRQESRLRELQAERERRVAALEPAVQAGDPAAMLAQAGEVLSGYRSPADLARGIGLLSRAAALDHPPAQALLGATLAWGQTRIGPSVHLPPELADRERGIALLKRAAARACTYGPGFGGPGLRWHVQPAGVLGSVYQYHDRAAARLWEARDLVHCGTPAVAELVARMGYPGWATRRQETMTLLLLAEDQPGIASGAAVLAAEQVAAARREAQDLRHRIAQSERDYPAPPLKEWK